jgi:hypothetical protein
MLPKIMRYYVEIVSVWKCLFGYIISQGCTNARRQVAVATKFCAVTPNICDSSVCHLLHVTLLALRILRGLLDFLKICATISYRFVDNKLCL